MGKGISRSVTWAGHSTLLRCAELSVVTALLLVIVAYDAPNARTFLVSAAALQLVAGALAFAARRSMSRHVEHLVELSEHDPATGCLNRRGFARVMQEAARENREAAMLALDLDYFKRINDRYGHSVGDIVLVEVSQVLMASVAEEGFVARLGGEEFGILLPDADAETAGVMAERMVARLRGLEIPVLRHGESVTMSVGVATERLGSARDIAALVARADEALYIAKRGGRDRALLWAPGVRSFATPAASDIIGQFGEAGMPHRNFGMVDRRRGLADRRSEGADLNGRPSRRVEDLDSSHPPFEAPGR